MVKLLTFLVVMVSFHIVIVPSQKAKRKRFYLFQNTGFDWNTAAYKCDSYNANLLKLDNVTDLNAFKYLTTDQLSPYSSWPGDKTWIGLFRSDDATFDHHWQGVCENATLSSIPTNWTSGLTYSSMTADMSANCAYIQGDYTVGFASCGEKVRAVCEKDVGTCQYKRNSNFMYNMSSNNVNTSLATTVMNIASCESYCSSIWLSGDRECWAVNYNLSSSICQPLTSQYPYEFVNQSIPNTDLISSAKNCYEMVWETVATLPAYGVTDPDPMCGPFIPTTTPSIPNAPTCKCDCYYVEDNRTTNQILEDLKKSNSIDKSQLSSFLLSKKSADDPRVSAKVIGSTLGICLLIAIGLFFMIIDIPYNIHRFLARKKRHKKAKTKSKKKKNYPAVDNNTQQRKKAWEPNDSEIHPEPEIEEENKTDASNSNQHTKTSSAKKESPDKESEKNDTLLLLNEIEIHNLVNQEGIQQENMLLGKKKLMSQNQDQKEINAKPSNTKMAKNKPQLNKEMQSQKQSKSNLVPNKNTSRASGTKQSLNSAEEQNKMLHADEKDVEACQSISHNDDGRLHLIKEDSFVKNTNGEKVNVGNTKQVQNKSLNSKLLREPDREKQSKPLLHKQTFSNKREHRKNKLTNKQCNNEFSPAEHRNKNIFHSQNEKSSRGGKLKKQNLSPSNEENIEHNPKNSSNKQVLNDESFGIEPVSLYNNEFQNSNTLSEKNPPVKSNEKHNSEDPGYRIVNVEMLPPDQNKDFHLFKIKGSNDTNDDKNENMMKQGAMLSDSNQTQGKCAVSIQPVNKKLSEQEIKNISQQGYSAKGQPKKCDIFKDGTVNREVYLARPSANVPEVSASEIKSISDTSVKKQEKLSENDTVLPTKALTQNKTVLLKPNLAPTNPYRQKIPKVSSHKLLSKSKKLSNIKSFSSQKISSTKKICNSSSKDNKDEDSKNKTNDKTHMP